MPHASLYFYHTLFRICMDMGMDMDLSMGRYHARSLFFLSSCVYTGSGSMDGGLMWNYYALVVSGVSAALLFSFIVLLFRLIPLLVSIYI
jgi:hypothetical protein